MNKLYSASTKTGHVLYSSATLDFLETKLEFTLNDLVEARDMDIHTSLKRKLKIKTKSDIYHDLFTSDKKGYYSITITRVL